PPAFSAVAAAPPVPASVPWRTSQPGHRAVIRRVAGTAGRVPYPVSSVAQAMAWSMGLPPVPNTARLRRRSGADTTATGRIDGVAFGGGGAGSAKGNPCRYRSYALLPDVAAGRLYGVPELC